MDFEGRVIRADFEKVSVISLYLPSGTNIDRLDYKFKFMDDFQNYINSLKKDYPRLVICGDYNICHRAIDIHDPVRNKNVSRKKNYWEPIPKTQTLTETDLETTKK